jgi:hypothetical protein
VRACVRACVRDVRSHKESSSKKTCLYVCLGNVSPSGMHVPAWHIITALNINLICSVQVQVQLRLTAKT